MNASHISPGACKNLSNELFQLGPWDIHCLTALLVKLDYMQVPLERKNWECRSQLALRRWFFKPISHSHVQTGSIKHCIVLKGSIVQMHFVRNLYGDSTIHTKKHSIQYFTTNAWHNFEWHINLEARRNLWILNNTIWCNQRWDRLSSTHECDVIVCCEPKGHYLCKGIWINALLTLCRWYMVWCFRYRIPLKCHSSIRTTQSMKMQLNFEIPVDKMRFVIHVSQFGNFVWFWISIVWTGYERIKEGHCVHI